MSSIFIETTIHIERLTAPPLRKALIHDTIHQHQTITSSYVWMEFQRTIGQDYQYLIDLLRQQRSTTISQLLSHIAESRNQFSPRRIKRLLHTIAKLLDQTKNAVFEPLEIAKVLERERDRLLYQQFFDGIAQMVDTTTCDLVRPGYTTPPGGRMSCRRETAHCSLPELLNTNTAALQKLQANSAAVSTLDVGTQRALAEIISDTTMGKGERNCWSLGDLIIVLECPPDALLWTTNLRHFEPLCQVLGRQLFQPANA